MKSAFLLPCVALALGGCAAGASDDPQPARAAALPDWRTIATDSDRHRLREWRTAWVQGLDKARAAGHGPALAKEGALLQPDAAIAWETPPAGNYRCRTVKVGGKASGMLDYVAYPPFECRIRDENGILSFAKLTGSQRPLGLLLPYRGERMIFLGTLQLGDERRALQYGHDRERDMAGLIERIGERRWRLVFPYPHFESTIDIIELIPSSSAS